MKISLFKSCKDTKPYGDVDFTTFLDNIKGGTWQDIVLKYRNMPLGDERSSFKSTYIPAGSVSGSFKARSNDKINNHSGIICMDIDDKDNPTMNIDRLQYDPYVYAYHQSVGGYGYAIYFKIEPDKHLEAFYSLERYLADNYQLICDPACKDIARLRFISYDPHLFKKDTSPPVFKQYLKETKKVKTRSVYPHTKSDIDYILKQISDRSIDLTDSYFDWMQIGFAFASEYGDIGREYFHIVSEQSPKYSPEATDAKFTELLRTHKGRVSIASFFYFCKQHGIELQTEETKKVERYTKAQILQGYKSDAQIVDSVTRLAQMEGIAPDKARQVAEQTLKIPVEELKRQKTENLIPEIKSGLQNYNLRYNEVTGAVEYDGKPLIDIDVNTIWYELSEKLGPKVSRNAIEDIINSKATVTYNPFTDFFNKYSDRRPSGNLDKLAKCITAQILTQSDKGQYDTAEIYVKKFVAKWVVSLIASMHGTYSLLILVLCGAQGVGKTNFFRHLLPDELKAYFGESKLDHGKDDHILMCTKLILLDDEFSGKSKQEYKVFKQLASTQNFYIRLPYGRRTQTFRRYAVLCGTSNDMEIINDPTGNRRIVPINVLSIDYEAYNSIDKIDLLIEAYHIYHAEGDQSWQLTTEEIEYLNNSTKFNEQTDIVQGAILMYFDIPKENEKADLMSPTEILNLITLNTRLNISAQRLGAVMKRLGFTQEVRRNDAKIVERVYKVRKKDLLHNIL